MRGVAWRRSSPDVSEDLSTTRSGGLTYVLAEWHYWYMCSSRDGQITHPVGLATATALTAAAARLSPSELSDVLHGVLGHLIAADLSALSSDEH